MYGWKHLIFAKLGYENTLILEGTNFNNPNRHKFNLYHFALSLIVSHPVCTCRTIKNYFYGSLFLVCFFCFLSIPLTGFCFIIITLPLFIYYYLFMSFFLFLYLTFAFPYPSIFRHIRIFLTFLESTIF